MVKTGQGCRIHSARGDDIPRKLCAIEPTAAVGRGGGIKDFLATKISLPLRQSWNSGDSCNPDCLPAALVVGKEERAGLEDRTANRSSELIATEFRFSAARRRKKVAGIKHLVTNKFKGGAVELIRPGLGGKVDHASIESAKLCRNTVAFNAEFLNGINHGEKHYLPWFRQQRSDTVKQVLIGSGPPPIDTRSYGSWRQR